MIISQMLVMLCRRNKSKSYRTSKQGRKQTTPTATKPEQKETKKVVGNSPQPKDKERHHR